MTTPAIPNGWRKLRKGTIIHKMDMFLLSGKYWELTSNYGDKIGYSGYISPITGKPLIYIRRKQKGAK